MATKLIGLYSPVAQSGKSTVAQHLASQHGFARHSFALPLKRMVIELMTQAGLSEQQIGHAMEAGKEEPLPQPIGVSFRYLCQTLGTDWGRKLVNNELWVGLSINKALAEDRATFEDMRFPNEFAAILAAGGEVWKVVRPGAERINGHPSEGLLDGFEFDRVLVNSGSVEDLRRAVTEALGQ